MKQITDHQNNCMKSEQHCNDPRQQCTVLHKQNSGFEVVRLIDVFWRKPLNVKRWETQISN